jgi:NADPH:quinone reductase
MTNTIPATRPARIRSLAPRPGAGRLRILPTMRGRGFVVGVVDANGPETVGFTKGDRVAWRDRGGDVPTMIILDHDDVLGVPDWVDDRQVVSYLGPGLVARALLRSSRPVSRGEAVQVRASDPIVAAAVAAWARSLGAMIVEQDAAVVVADAPEARRRATSSHGVLAQTAVEVFQAIRAGVFDDVPGVVARHRSDDAAA